MMQGAGGVQGALRVQQVAALQGFLVGAHTDIAERSAEYARILHGGGFTRAAMRCAAGALRLRPSC